VGECNGESSDESENSGETIAAERERKVRDFQHRKAGARQ